MAAIRQGLQLFGELKSERQRFQMIVATLLPHRHADKLMRLWREVGNRQMVVISLYMLPLDRHLNCK